MPSLTGKKKVRAARKRAPELPTRVIGPCKATEGQDVAASVGRDDGKVMDELVARFLGWPLPKSVCADLCATDRNYQFPRSGTNLLDVNEARQMLEYVLKGRIVT